MSGGLAGQGHEDTRAQRGRVVDLQQVLQTDAKLAEQAQSQLAPRRDPQAVATVAEAGRVGCDQAHTSGMVGMNEFHGGSIVVGAGSRRPAA